MNNPLTVLLGESRDDASKWRYHMETMKSRYAGFRASVGRLRERGSHLSRSGMVRREPYTPELPPAPPAPERAVPTAMTLVPIAVAVQSEIVPVPEINPSTEILPSPEPTPSALPSPRPPAASAERTTLELPPALEAFVRAKVGSGRYTSASEVVRDALRLMEDRDHLVSTHGNRVWKQIADGLDVVCDAPAMERETVLEEVEAQLDRLEAQLNRAAVGIDGLIGGPDSMGVFASPLAGAESGNATIDGGKRGEAAASETPCQADALPARADATTPPAAGPANDAFHFEQPAAWVVRPVDPRESLPFSTASVACDGAYRRVPEPDRHPFPPTHGEALVIRG